MVSPGVFSEFRHGDKLVVHGKDAKEKFAQRLRDDHLKYLQDFLSQNLSMISSINLSYNKITSIGLETLVDILVSHQHITELILSNNDIDGEGIKYLAEKKLKMNLKCLRINGNKLWNNTENYFIDFLTDNSKLKYLDLGETDMTIDAFRKLAPSIAKSKVTGLVISSVIGFNSKTEDTASISRSILIKSTSLSMLYLRKLQLTDSDVEILYDGLKTHQGLLLLDLSGNCISDVGADFLVKYVSKSKRLQCLILNHNRVSDVTSYSLSTVVPGSSIFLLDVSYNSITDEGLLHLLHILQRRSLRILLWGNTIGPQSLEKFKTLHDLGGVFPHRIDVAVKVGPYDVVQYDHNRDLDVFTENYYSLDSRLVRKEAIWSYTFPFYQIR